MNIGILLAQTQNNLDQLQKLNISQLELLWRHCLPKQPIPELKCLLWQGLAWRLQSNGQSIPLATQKLIGLAMKVTSSSLTKVSGLDVVPVPASPTPIPEGTRLVRKWRGRLYEVSVSNGGADFHFNGKLYKSLSHIAEEITGAHWSGPRFFGLKKLKKKVAHG